MPCRAGLSVMAVACAIGELPMPASLEKMPRAIPKRIAAQTVAPAKPPGSADTGVNALLTIVATAERDFRKIQDQNEDAGGEIADRHERHETSRHLADALDTAQQHQPDQNRRNDAADDGMRPEGMMHRIGDRIGLHGIADAETGEHAEAGEEKRQPFPFFAQSLADIVHGAADIVAVFILFAEMHREYRFGKLRRHAGQRDQPHPEQRTRPAAENRRGHPRDIAGAHRGGHRGHQGVERGNIAGRPFLAAAAPHHPETVENAALHHETVADGQEKAGSRQKRQQYGAADETVELFDQFDNAVHADADPFRWLQGRTKEGIACPVRYIEAGYCNKRMPLRETLCEPYPTPCRISGRTTGEKGSAAGAPTAPGKR